MVSTLIKLLVVVLSFHSVASDEAFCGQKCNATLKCGSKSCSLCQSFGPLDTSYCIRGKPIGSVCVDDADCYPFAPNGTNVACIANKTNKTCGVMKPDSSAAIGYSAILVAALFFGTNFVPVKKFDAGDGVFFQWIMCVAIWIVGLAVNIFRDCPQFHPIAMLGGIIWCTGNIMVVPTVAMLGLALGLAIWGSSNIVCGWGFSKFGILEHAAADPLRPIMSYLGVGCAVVAAVVFATVKPSMGDEDEHQRQYILADRDTDDEEDKLKDFAINDIEKVKAKKAKGSSVKLIGVTLAIVQGCFYGVNFVPPTHQMDHSYEYEQTHNRLYSRNGLDYVFSHFCGIFLASTFYMIVYCVFKKNNPVVNNQIILPALCSGLMWGIAQVAFFIANDNLSQVVSFPIIGTGPSVVSAMWGILLFKEITGKRNFITLAVGFVFVAGTAGLIAGANA